MCRDHGRGLTEKPSHLGSCPVNKKVDELAYDYEPQVLYDGDVDFEVSELFIGSITKAQNHGSWMEVVHVNGTDVQFKLDTGAQCNVLPQSIIPNVHLSPTGIKSVSWSNHKITPLGTVWLTCTVNEGSYKLLFIVVDKDFVSSSWC